jgi:hypothetical protein
MQLLARNPDLDIRTSPAVGVNKLAPYGYLAWLVVFARSVAVLALVPLVLVLSEGP